jgi:hypothetical protein
LHSKVVPASLEKPKLAELLVTSPLGPESIVVWGGVRSIVQACAAELESVFPAWSVARTAKVCGPAGRAPYSAGEVHETYAAPSRLHAKPEPVSEDEKVNDGVTSLVGSAGFAPMVVSGSVRSTVQARAAGVGSTFPAASIARTRKSYAPSARPE